MAGKAIGLGGPVLIDAAITAGLLGGGLAARSVGGRTNNSTSGLPQGPRAQHPPPDIGPSSPSEVKHNSEEADIAEAKRMQEMEATIERMIAGASNGGIGSALNRFQEDEKMRRLDRVHQEGYQYLLDAFRGDPTIDDAVGQVSAAAEEIPNRANFLRRLYDSGMTAERWRTIRERVSARLGTTQQARAALSRVLINRVLPAMAGAAVTYGLGKAWPVDRDKKGGIANVSEDEEIERALADEDPAAPFNNSIRAPHSAFDKNAFNKAYNSLPGSASGTASPYLPFGPIDTVLPKSSPSIPSSAPDPISRLPGTTIFTDGLAGDSLSERPSTARANVLKSSIPVPPIINYVPPHQYYANIEHPGVHVEQPLMASPAQNLKRKADSISTHQDRAMESQIPQNYDPAFVPGMPSSVNANSSVQWREYTAPYTGYNVPLTAAPNIAELYVPETSERELAESTPEPDQKQYHNTENNTNVTVPEKQTEPQTNTINTANETNPALRNVDKNKTNPTTQLPPPANHLRP